MTELKIVRDNQGRIPTTILLASSL